MSAKREDKRVKQTAAARAIAESSLRHHSPAGGGAGGGAPRLSGVVLSKDDMVEALKRQNEELLSETKALHAQVQLMQRTMAMTQSSPFPDVDALFVEPAFAASPSEENSKVEYQFICSKPNTASVIMVARSMPLPPFVAKVNPEFTYFQYLLTMTDPGEKKRWVTVPIAPSAGETYPLDSLSSSSASCGFGSSSASVRAYEQLRAICCLSGSALIEVALGYSEMLQSLVGETYISQQVVKAEFEQEQYFIDRRISEIHSRSPPKVFEIVTLLNQVIKAADILTNQKWVEMAEAPLDHVRRLSFAASFAYTVNARRRALHAMNRSFDYPSEWVWSCLLHIVDVNSVWTTLVRSYSLVVLSPLCLPATFFSSEKSQVPALVFFDSLCRTIVWSFQHASSSGLLRCSIACTAITALINLRSEDLTTSQLFNKAHNPVFHSMFLSVYNNIILPAHQDSCLQSSISHKFLQLLNAVGILPPSSATATASHVTAAAAEGKGLPTASPSSSSSSSATAAALRTTAPPALPTLRSLPNPAAIAEAVRAANAAKPPTASASIPPVLGPVPPRALPPPPAPRALPPPPHPRPLPPPPHPRPLPPPPHPPHAALPAGFSALPSLPALFPSLPSLPPLPCLLSDKEKESKTRDGINDDNDCRIIEATRKDSKSNCQCKLTIKVRGQDSIILNLWPEESWVDILLPHVIPLCKWFMVLNPSFFNPLFAVLEELAGSLKREELRTVEQVRDCFRNACELLLTAAGPSSKHMVVSALILTHLEDGVETSIEIEEEDVWSAHPFALFFSWFCSAIITSSKKALDFSDLMESVSKLATCARQLARTVSSL